MGWGGGGLASGSDVLLLAPFTAPRIPPAGCGNTGTSNLGHYNSGSNNQGSRNSGSNNYGNCNAGSNVIGSGNEASNVFSSYDAPAREVQRG